MSEPLFRDPTASVADRVRDLLARMTLTEKVGQVNQRMYGWDAYERTSSGHRLTEAFRTEVSAYDGMGALYGLQRADPWSGVTAATGIGAADGARVCDDVQRHVVENTRLGIPVLLVEEMPHGLQALDGTLLPVNLAVGATWNPELYEEAVASAAAQALAHAPGVRSSRGSIHRDRGQIVAVLRATIERGADLRVVSDAADRASADLAHVLQRDDMHCSVQLRTAGRARSMPRVH